MVIFGRLVAYHSDFGGYITYVFQNLDKCTPSLKYVMCTRWPNWDCDTLQLGDEGYLHYEERRAGIDEWWDGNQFIKYKYDNLQFVKFVPKAVKEDFGNYVID